MEKASLQTEDISTAEVKSRSSFYRPELDILRFLAFLLVFIHHVLPISLRPSLVWRVLRSARESGAFGVCLFFLLSSYLITELLFRELKATGDIHVPSFYVRRILRIWPLYFFMLFAGFVFSRVNPAYPVTKGRLLAFLLLVGNWYTARFNFTTNFISPLWSISLEEQFYLLWPTVMRFGRRRGILIASLALWAGAYVALAVLCRQQASLGYTIWANSFVQFQYFALGGLLALVLRGRTLQLHVSMRGLLLLCGLLAFFYADFTFHAMTTTMAPRASLTLPGYALIGVGAVLLFFSLLGARVPRAAQPLVYLGKISYGLYVFHAMAFQLVSAVADRFLPANVFVRVSVTIPLTFALTVLLAAASYRYLESPFLRLKERFTFVRSRGV